MYITNIIWTEPTELSASNQNQPEYFRFQISTSFGNKIDRSFGFGTSLFFFCHNFTCHYSNILYLLNLFHITGHIIFFFRYQSNYYRKIFNINSTFNSGDSFFQVKIKFMWHNWLYVTGKNIFIVTCHIVLVSLVPVLFLNSTHVFRCFFV